MSSVLHTAKYTISAVIVAFCLAIPGSRSNAQVSPPTYDDSTVWLWLDLQGKCPDTCDRNKYDCPCHT